MQNSKCVSKKLILQFYVQYLEDSAEKTVYFPKIEIPLVSVLPNGKVVDGPSVCYEALLRESNTQRLVFTLTEANEVSCE